MISTLPLLPSAFGQWDWENSNGTASIDQTKKSYQALIEKDLCSNFSRFVWNDIVDMTANALSSAGISWDTAYGSADDCKITQYLGELTASKFNGVAVNINRLGLFSWKWAQSKSTIGYVGRDIFYGVSTHGKNADNLYAWYIIELTRKLNWLIRFLKDEVPFSESRQISVVNSFAPVKLSGSHSVPIKSNICCASHGLSDLKRIAVASLPHRSTSAAAIYQASLIEPAETQYLRYCNQSRSYVAVEMEANIVDMLASLISAGSIVSALSSSYSQKLLANIIPTSMVNANLFSSPPEILSAFVHSDFMLSPEMTSISGMDFCTASFSETMSSSEITTKIINPLRYARKDDSVTDAIIHTLFSASILPEKTEEESYIAAYMKVNQTAPMCRTEQSNFVIIDDMNTCLAASAKFYEYIQAQYHAGIYADLVRSIGSSILTYGYDSSKLNSCDAIHLGSDDTSCSYAGAEIQSGIQFTIDSASESTSDSSGQIMIVPKHTLEAVHVSFDEYDVSIRQCEPTIFKISCASASSVNVSMELEYNTPDIWYDPIQTDRNVYIRSAYPQRQNGTNVHLGK